MTKIIANSELLMQGRFSREQVLTKIHYACSLELDDELQSFFDQLNNSAVYDGAMELDPLME